MRYRKKPAVIEAWRVVIGAPMPEWLAAALTDGSVRPHAEHQHHINNWGRGGVLIDTLEGTMHAQVGDWIIRGVKDELYPCKPDIFEATYEPAGRWSLRASMAALRRLAGRLA